MKINDLLDLTLREILENYFAIQNLECGYFYGIVPDELVEQIFNEYNIDEEYPEAFSVENIVNDELLLSHNEEVLDYETLVRIMENLGINKKSDVDD